MLAPRSLVIWKFQFPVDWVLENDGIVEKSVPEFFQPIHVAFQEGVPTLWAIVDPTQESTTKIFGIFPTGKELPKNDGDSEEVIYNYIGSCISPLVMHMFEVVNIKLATKVAPLVR